MPAAGRLDRRVDILRATTSVNEIGEQLEQWNVWRTVWAGKKDIRADERLRADQELATETTVWISHYIPGLTVRDRFSVEGKVYDIIGLAELGRRAGLEITTTANLDLPPLAGQAFSNDFG